jgi:hypothetical protein
MIFSYYYPTFSVLKNQIHKIMQNLLKFKEYVKSITEGTTGELLKPKRNKPMEFDPKKHPELAGELFNLIATAYSEIGGHAKITKPSDIFADPDWNFWEGIDIHGDENFDIVMFGQKTRYGIKFSGIGHDGSRDAKKRYLEDRGRDLHKLGYYIEVSGKLADILINRYNCPVVDNQQEVEKVLNKKVNWLSNGWYERSIGGHQHEKILLGKPKI